MTIYIACVWFYSQYLIFTCFKAYLEMFRKGYCIIYKRYTNVTRTCIRIRYLISYVHTTTTKFASSSSKPIPYLSYQVTWKRFRPIRERVTCILVSKKTFISMHCCLVTPYGGAGLANYWCLVAPSHYLNQCCLTINENPWHLFRGNINMNTLYINPKIMFGICTFRWVNARKTQLHC